MPYYLGIDGGGTKTTCAVGDETRLIATATAGPSNVVRVGEVQASESLQQSVRQACAAAGIALAQVARTCVGGSGAARPELAEIVRRSLAEILSTPIDVVGDMQIALEAAFDTGPGVVVIAGTGSIAYGRDRQGRTVRAGGWGFAIGDEGSAHWIGRAAVSAVLRAADRFPSDRFPSDLSPSDLYPAESRDGTPETRTHSSFAEALFKIWGVRSLADLARAGNSIPPPDFAALFPAVAASTDDLATQVLARAGKELASIAAVVILRLFAKDQSLSVPVAMTGGVFRHAPLVRQVFYNELRAMEPRAVVNPQVVEPVEGALRMARRAAAEEVTPQ
ncbi:MAG TPA: BadF/BadG/BcrA/BcrD ATPase family protein [Candidatus Sulfotelmatobacter sp.]|nr:BadF/BadG/BcrA/BcrD ATPase family protein [Candidatus Sulfotelmatobacter sp.]